MIGVGTGALIMKFWRLDLHTQKVGEYYGVINVGTHFDVRTRSHRGTVVA